MKYRAVKFYHGSKVDKETKIIGPRSINRIEKRSQRMNDEQLKNHITTFKPPYNNFKMQLSRPIKLQVEEYKTIKESDAQKFKE